MSSPRAHTAAAAPKAPDWGLWLAASLVVVTAIRILALYLSKTDLFFDEAQYWSWAKEPAFGYFSKPPLIAWVIAATTAVCGDGEACTRLSSPLFHAASAVFIYLTAARLYSRPIAFWAALIFVTLPGISFSSNIVSTDVPLLFFWSAALYFAVRLVDERSWFAAILCAAAIGLGALSKYAMLYVYLCGALWLIWQPKARWLLKDWKGLALIVIPLLFLAPNLYWVTTHGLVTFTHTADNARLGHGSLIHPGSVLEFLGGQLGVFGPILFPMLLLIAVRDGRPDAAPQTRFLLSFAVPILAVITIVAFLSRAHANWAATAYPAAAILVVATMLLRGRRGLFLATLAVNAIAFAALAVAPALADRPGPLEKVYSRTLGWRETGDKVAEALRGGDYGMVLTDDRAVTAELLYYLRGSDVPIRAWKRPGPPMDHFQLTRPFTGAGEAPVLYVTLNKPNGAVTRRFRTVTPLASFKVPSKIESDRTVVIEALSDYEGANDDQ